ncbi:MAG: hypothetical protein ABI562_03455 [Chloroflexota bacterium]
MSLYPRWWRRRYGEEMRALLELAPPTARDRLDLARGALDAWLHPPEPSRVPIAAALVGGGLWTIIAARVAAQPVPPDWPGYLVEIVPLALLAAVGMLVAVVGVALRQSDSRWRWARLTIGLAILGYGAWIFALVGTAAGVVDAVTLGAAQTAAMLAGGAIGFGLIRVGDERVGPLVLTAAGVMLVPWVGAWLVFGACWTAIGMVLMVERSARFDLHPAAS